MITYTITLRPCDAALAEISALISGKGGCLLAKWLKLWTEFQVLVQINNRFFFLLFGVQSVLYAKIEKNYHVLQRGH